MSMTDERIGVKLDEAIEQGKPVSRESCLIAWALIMTFTVMWEFAQLWQAWNFIQLIDLRLDQAELQILKFLEVPNA